VSAQPSSGLRAPHGRHVLPPQLGGLAGELMQHRSPLAERVRPFVDFAARVTAVVFVHDDEALVHLALEVIQDVFGSIDTAVVMECIVLQSGQDALVSVGIAAEMELCVLELSGCIAPARSSP